MPSNPNKDDHRARVSLNRILTRALPTVGQMLYTDLIRETLLNFEVSERMVKQFIQAYYIEPGMVKLQDGLLIWNGQVIEVENDG